MGLLGHKSQKMKQLERPKVTNGGDKNYYLILLRDFLNIFFDITVILGITIIFKGLKSLFLCVILLVFLLSGLFYSLVQLVCKGFVKV